MNENLAICSICNKKLKSINTAHLKTHGLDLKEYNILFGLNDKSKNICSYEYHNPDKRYKDLLNFKCNLQVSKNSKDNMCILHDKNPNKDKDKFSKTFKIVQNIYEIQDRDFHFEGITFPIDIELSEKTFNNKIYFTDSVFLGKVKIQSTFNSIVDFRRCNFHEAANFEYSNFNEEANFSGSVFHNLVNFQCTSFVADAHFWKITFLSNANFHETGFSKRVFFGNCKFPKNENFVRFLNTFFHKPSQVLFTGVDFSNTLFRWTDLTAIKFDKVNWPLTQKICGARRYLTDEDIASKKRKTDYIHSLDENFKDTQNSYQQLKKNYEERRKYSEAGDFYFGEMECYRKSSWARRYLPSLVNLYRISSGYGQRYIRAGIVLILMLLFFAVAHVLLGLEPTLHNSDYTKIQYSFNLDFNKSESFISDLFIATIYCVEVLIREEEPDRLFRPKSTKGDILNSTFSILVYLQVLFFILAVRRHFKR